MERGTAKWISLTAGGCAVISLIRRSLRRRREPVITAMLRCDCGEIQGNIRAIREDSFGITCFCEDCRTYAAWVVTQQDGGSDANRSTSVGKCGETRLVQVCKSAVEIEKGKEKLLLARKSPSKGMYRYYAGCCSVPIMNTIKGLGFVGVFMDRLSNEKIKFYGPFAGFPEEALMQPDPPVEDIWVPEFLWRLLRYQPYYNAGPFDYDLDAKYWGDIGKKRQ